MPTSAGAAGDVLRGHWWANHQWHARRSRTGGFALLAVLVVAMMTSLIVVSLMFRVQAEESAHAAAVSGEQSRAVAMSGIAQAMQVARDNAHADQIWRDNPESFREQLVLDDGANRWYFSLYAPPAEEGGEIRFGLTDEASRLNLHRVNADAIATLPDVSLPIAEAIKALIGGEGSTSGGSDSGSDSDAEPVGEDDAESPSDAIDSANSAGPDDPADPSDSTGGDIFDQLLDDEATDEVDDTAGMEEEADDDFTLFDDDSAPATRPPNFQGFVTLDHLLTLDEVNVALLYGRSSDEEEAADAAPRSVSALNLPPGNAERLRNTTLRDLATLISREPNVDSRGNARINIADTEADLTQLGVSEEVIAAIEARREGDEPMRHVLDVLMTAPPEEEEGEGDGESEESDEIDEATGSTSEEASDEEMTEFAVAVEPDELRRLLDRATVKNEALIRGRVNLNTAPVEVLAALPGIDESIAENIVSSRDSLDEEQRTTIAWLLEDELLELQQFVDVAPYLTTRSYQFHVRVFAYAMPSRRYRVMEAVIDIAGERPRVVFLRDLTRLGPPLPMSDNAGSSSSTLARIRP